MAMSGRGTANRGGPSVSSLGGEAISARPQSHPRFVLLRTYSACEGVRLADHFSAFCETLTQSEDRLDGQPLIDASREFEEA